MKAAASHDPAGGRVDVDTVGRGIPDTAFRHSTEGKRVNSRRGNEDHRYRQVAQRLMAQIDAGVFVPGQRLPSIRQLMAQEGISLSTANLAIVWLEQHGYLLAKPRSGCFVHPQLRTRVAEPDTTRTALALQPVRVNRLVADVNLATQMPELVHLGAAVVHHSLLPTRELNQALAHVARQRGTDCARYALPPGNAELRRQIAILSRDWGCDLSADDIVVTAGDTDALELALRTVARPGDRIAIESPTYFGILQTIENLGMQALEIATHPRTGLDVDELIRATETDPVAAVVLNPTFHNPFGCCMPDEEKARLVEWINSKRLPLIEDDVFGDLYFGAQRPRPCKAFDREGGVLTCSSFSKTLAPGYRVGWCVPGRFREDFIHLQFGRALAVSAPPQLAIADYLGGRGYPRHLKGLRELFAAQRTRARARIAQALPAGARVTDPIGGFVFWVELPEGTDGFAVYRESLDAGVTVTPGRMFSAAGHFNHCLRLSVALPWSSQVESAIDTVGKIALAHSQRGTAGR